MDIPRNFAQYTAYSMFRQDPLIKANYSWIPQDERPSACTECGNCEELCPQGLPIQEHLKAVTAVFAGA